MLCAAALAGCASSGVGGAARAGGGEQPAATVATVHGDPVHARAPRRTPLHWDLDEADVARIDDPWEAFAVRLVDGLVGEDRRRMLRHFGAPVVFASRTTGQPRLDYLRADERAVDAHDDYVDGVLPSMLRGPLRAALRGLPLAVEVEEQFDEMWEDGATVAAPLDVFRPDAGSTDWGRPTVRVRAGDLGDPIELGYRREGLRVGSSAERLKVRFEVPLWENAWARLGWTHRYTGRGADADDVRVELAWNVDADTLLHVAGSSRTELFAGPSTWSQDRSPRDPSPGLVFYVERIF